MDSYKSNSERRTSNAEVIVRNFDPSPPLVQASDGRLLARRPKQTMEFARWGRNGDKLRFVDPYTFFLLLKTDLQTRKQPLAMGRGTGPGGLAEDR
jgi:hypothetical protein